MILLIRYVLVPYKITLLSNFKGATQKVTLVLVPYKITLLSNHQFVHIGFVDVLVPYKITLLSNGKTAATLTGLF